jgi:hypothetical protein
MPKARIRGAVSIFMIIIKNMNILPFHMAVVSMKFYIEIIKYLHILRDVFRMLTIKIQAIVHDIFK